MIYSSLNLLRFIPSDSFAVGLYHRAVTFQGSTSASRCGSQLPALDGSADSVALFGNCDLVQPGQKFIKRCIIGEWKDTPQGRTDERQLVF